MADREGLTSQPATPRVRPWVFRIWLVFAMTVGAMMGHSIAFSAFGHPKGQPQSVMYWFAGLIGLGSLIGAVVAYATKSGLSIEPSAKR